jgi:hypothetical protein
MNFTAHNVCLYRVAYYLLLKISGFLGLVHGSVFQTEYNVLEAGCLFALS